MVGPDFYSGSQKAETGGSPQVWDYPGRTVGLCLKANDSNYNESD